ERRHEDLAGLRAARAEDDLVLQRVQVAGPDVAGDVMVREADGRLDVLDGLGRRLAHQLTRKQTMSRIDPVRSLSGAQTASTRAPTRSASTSSRTTWASAVSAPSRRTRTKANGAGNGWRPSTARWTTATAVTVPVGRTSTQSPPSEPSASE